MNPLDVRMSTLLYENSSPEKQKMYQVFGLVFVLLFILGIVAVINSFLRWF